MDRKKVLVAGANGYVGSRLCYKLAEMGFTVIVLVRNKQRFTVDADQYKNIEVIEADLLQKKS